MSRHAVLTIVMVAAISLVAPSPPVQAQDKPSAQELADVPEDNQEARQRFVEALRKYNDLLEGGDAQTQFSLGSMFFTGSDGVPENQALAVTWWRRAAEQGHADAQFNLGVVYSNGNGVPQDDAESVTWYRLAAEQGHADAQNQLGMRYAEGTGVPQDDTEAVAWYRKAAEQGNADAQFNLGLRYVNGGVLYGEDGVPQDFVEAATWYRKAAEQGHVGAQLNLGNMHGGVALLSPCAV